MFTFHICSECRLTGIDHPPRTTHRSNQHLWHQSRAQGGTIRRRECSSGDRSHAGGAGCRSRHSGLAARRVCVRVRRAQGREPAGCHPGKQTSAARQHRGGAPGRRIPTGGAGTGRPFGTAAGTYPGLAGWVAGGEIPDQLHLLKIRIAPHRKGRPQRRHHADAAPALHPTPPRPDPCATPRQPDRRTGYPASPSAGRPPPHPLLLLKRTHPRCHPRRRPPTLLLRRQRRRTIPGRSNPATYHYLRIIPAHPSVHARGCHLFRYIR